MRLIDIEHNGRKYKAYGSPEDATPGAYVIVGPPEGLVDELGIPEPHATRLHNILYQRGLITAKDASAPNAMLGAIKEFEMVEAQIIVEKFFLLERETAIGGLS